MGYGQTFDEAMTSLFGDLGRPQPRTKPETSKRQANRRLPKPVPPLLPLHAPALNVQQLINKAVQEFDEYQRLTSQGKLGEAGQKLEQHKRTLEELKKASANKP